MESTNKIGKGSMIELWPALPYTAWSETRDTLHLRTRIVGKVRLALTFFSGRRAPVRPGADRITREAYSHEVISCGFWPGNEQFKAAAFYAYNIPEPPGFPATALRPDAAFYRPEPGEFLLRYEDVRQATEPEQMPLDFLSSAYEAAANLAQWDRAALERGPGNSPRGQETPSS